MVVGTSPERPVVHTLVGLDRQVIDAGDTCAHQPVFVEFPVLVAVAAEPVTAIIVPFVGETHRDTVVTKGPHLLDQAVVELLAPLAPKKGLYGIAALEEFGAVAPLTVDAIGECHLRGVARVPSIFGHAGLLRRRLGREGWQWRTLHGFSPSRMASSLEPNLAPLRRSTSGRQFGPPWIGKKERSEFAAAVPV